MNKQSAWPTVRLKDVIVDMQPGFARRPNPDERGTPQLRPNNISPEGLLDLSAVKYVQASSSELEKYSVQKGDVIFNNTNSLEWVGKTAYLDSEERFAISNHMTRIRVNLALLEAEFLARYLHYLWKIGLPRRWAKQWVNQAAVDQAGLAQFPVLLPTLLEQRHIVAILRQADELRRLREKAKEKARQILPAIFYAMFGTPTDTPHPIKPLDELINLERPITYGILKPGPDVAGGVPYVRVLDIKDGRLDIDQLHRTTPSIAEQYSRSTLEPGDVLVTIRGTVGRVCIVPNELRGANITQDTARLALTEDVEPDYLIGFLNTSWAQNWMVHHMVGQVVQGINLGELKKLPVPIPSLPAQRKFTARVAAVWEFEEKQISSSQLMDDLLQSLGQAFRGELTAFWREQNHDELQKATAQRDAVLDSLTQREATLDLTNENVRKEFTRQVASLTTPAVQELLDVLDNQRQLDFSQQYNFIALAEQIKEALPQYADQVRDVLFAVVANLNYGLQKSLSEQRARLSDLTSNTLDNVVVQDTAHFYIVLALALSNAAVTAQEISAQKTAPQAGREVREAFSSTLQTLLQVAEARLAYFHPGDLVHDEIDLATAEEGLDLLTALGFVRPVRIEGKKAYCLVYDGQEPISVVGEQS